MNNAQHYPQSNPGQVPGIVLLIVGLLSFLCCGYFAFSTYSVSSNPEALAEFEKQFEAQMEKQKEGMSEDEAAQLDEMMGGGKMTETVLSYVKMGMIFSVVGVVLSLLMCLGGFGLIKGIKGLGMIGGLAALVPQWCCIVGFPVGIWAIMSAMKIGKNGPGVPPAQSNSTGVEVNL